MQGGRTRVRFLIRSADGANGVARSILTTAGYLARDHDVEVVSVFRRRDVPVYDVPDGVRVTYLEDRRTGAAETGRRLRLLAGLPSLLLDRRGGWTPRCTLLTDLRLLRFLRTVRDGVLITTRPELHLMAARYTSRRPVLVAQEHMNYLARPEWVRKALARSSRRLNAMVVLTPRDVEDYLHTPGWRSDAVHYIPNSMPWSVGHDGRSRSKVVVAAGRLNRQKGFDQLIEAYSPVARAHPDWHLQIYGVGGKRRELQGMIDANEVGAQISLMGWTDDLDEALANASVFALSSRFEGMPLVVLEAMSKGLPTVSFDCHRGPRELIRDGVNGLLVDDGDIPAFTDALKRVIEDDGLRQEMGQTALVDANAYDRSAVGKQWERLLEKLVAK